MTVIVANDTPPAVRGMLKRWFIEPRPNVFVGTVNRRTREKTLEYVRRNAPELGLLVIAADNSCQGFSMETYGQTHRAVANINGLYLVAESWQDLQEQDAQAESPSDQSTGAEPSEDCRAKAGRVQGDPLCSEDPLA